MELHYIKIQQIADDLMQHPLLQNIPFDRIVNYAQELIQLIGSPKLFEDKIAPIHIEHHRGQLPCDFIKVTQVRGAGCNCVEYVSTMNSFHGSDGPCNDFVETPTYKIQGDVIITSTEHGDIEMAYKAIPVDEDGWPMFPDNVHFKLALEAYIKMRQFEVFLAQDKINANAYKLAQDDYFWRAGQAQSDLIMLSYDEMETLTNVWNQLIPRVTEHRNGFATAHNKQYIRRH